MCISWKATSALFVLVLVGAGGCAAGGEDAASEGETLAAAEADEGQRPGFAHGAPGEVNVTVNVNEIGSNDSSGHRWHGHGHGWGGHHHGCHAQPPPDPSGAAAPPAPPPPPPPPASDQPG